MGVRGLAAIVGQRQPSRHGERRRGGRILITSEETERVDREGA